MGQEGVRLAAFSHHGPGWSNRPSLSFRPLLRRRRPSLMRILGIASSTTVVHLVFFCLESAKKPTSAHPFIFFSFGPGGSTILLKGQKIFFLNV